MHCIHKYLFLSTAFLFYSLREKKENLVGEKQIIYALNEFVYEYVFKSY